MDRDHIRPVHLDPFEELVGDFLAELAGHRGVRPQIAELSQPGSCSPEVELVHLRSLCPLAAPVQPAPCPREGLQGQLPSPETPL